MFGILWRLVLLTICFALFFFPFINLVAWPVYVPLGFYCAVSATARIWRRNVRAGELSS